MKKCLSAILLATILCVFEAKASGIPKAPRGKKVLYTYTGAVHSLVNGIATCATCTNSGNRSVEVIVQFFDKDGTSNGDILEFVKTIEANDPLNFAYFTNTFCTSQTAFYSSEFPGSPVSDSLDQGFVRVLVDRKQAKNLICDVVVLDSTAKPPSFIYPLHGVRSNKYKTTK